MRRIQPENVPVAGTALFLIDVTKVRDFEDSDGLVAQADPMSVRLSALKRRAATAGVPCLYINDNFGQWRSDFHQTVTHCTSRSSQAPRVIPPAANDQRVFPRQ